MIRKSTIKSLVGRLHYSLNLFMYGLLAYIALHSKVTHWKSSPARTIFFRLWKHVWPDLFLQGSSTPLSSDRTSHKKHLQLLIMCFDPPWHSVAIFPSCFCHYFGVSYMKAESVFFFRTCSWLWTSLTSLSRHFHLGYQWVGHQRCMLKIYIYKSAKSRSCLFMNWHGRFAKYQSSKIYHLWRSIMSK